MTVTLRGPVRKERPAPVARTVERRDASGTVLSTVELEPTIFGIEPNLAVLHQVVTAQLGAKRSGTQSTRTRAEVRGGGAKPYRQKGTGNARQGSTRAPHYVGGGVAHAPKPRSYAQRTPKKMIRLALRSALSDRASESKVALIDRFGWEEPKTKDAVALFGALGLEGTVLVVLSRADAVASRTFRNLVGAHTVDARRAQRLRHPRPRLDPVHRRDPADGERQRRRGRGLMRESMSVLHPRWCPRRPRADRHRVYLVSTSTSTPTKTTSATRWKEAFGVKVTKVNTLRRKGKMVRNRRTRQVGRRNDTKRAIVTLAPNNKIDLFEG